MGRLERGEGVVRRWQLEALSGRLGVTVNWLLNGDPTAPERPAPSDSESADVDVGRQFTRQYRVCPSCGQDGIAAEQLHEHLTGRQCARVHSSSEADKIIEDAPVDPHPWAFVVARYERQLAAAKRAARFRLKGREHWRSLIGLLEVSRDRVLRLGPSEFFIRNPALDDPYFIREAGMAPQLDWAATMERALELQEKFQEDGDSN